MQVKVDDVTQTGAGYFVHFRLLDDNGDPVVLEVRFFPGPSAPSQTQIRAAIKTRLDQWPSDHPDTTPSTDSFSYTKPQS